MAAGEPRSPVCLNAIRGRALLAEVVLMCLCSPPALLIRKVPSVSGQVDRDRTLQQAGWRPGAVHPIFFVDGERRFDRAEEVVPTTEGRP